MSLVGDASSIFGMLSKGWSWWQSRHDPALRSARSLIRAFEAHGVGRQQIIRLVPTSVAQARPELSMADFSKPEQLKFKLSPALLDWAAEFLNVRRAWLDGKADTSPHHIVNHYQQPALYGPWFADRMVQAPDVDRVLTVVTTHNQPVGPDASGPVFLVYEEIENGLDGEQFSRYWLLSDEWYMYHPPCVENMAAAVSVADSAGVLVIGKQLPLRELVRLQNRETLLPELMGFVRGTWYPTDLVNPPPLQDSPWRQAVWQGAKKWLERAA